MTTTLKRCLIVDDDESFRQLVARYIKNLLPEAIVEEYDPSTSDQPEADFDWDSYDLVILDYLLNTSLTGLDLLNEWKKQEHFPPVIMLTGKGSEDIAVRAMKTGVQDYLRKQDITEQKLKQAIVDAVESYTAKRERIASSTHSNQSFNKALFYKKLELASDAANPQQLFVLIELDQFEELGEQHGVVLQDNLARHVAKTAYADLEGENYSTSMTRMSDGTIGLLFTLQTGKSVTDELKSLKKRLDASPFDNAGQPLAYTVSIGAVSLAKSGSKANDIIQDARALCQRLRENGGNGISVYGLEEPSIPASAGTPPVSESAASAVKATAPASTPQTAPKPTTDNASSSKTAVGKTNANRQPPPSEDELLGMTLEMPTEQHGKSADDPGTGSFDILQAFSDNRLLQYFQPIMPLSDAANQLDQEYFSTRIRMVDTNGSIIEPDKIIPELHENRNQKLLDRWQLRQTIGRIISFRNKQQQAPVFFIKMSEESFADADLFNWLQSKLMKPLGKLDAGKSLCVEVAAETYLARQRQVQALFKFLRQSYGFRFALSSFGDVAELQRCAELDIFDLYKISQPLLSEIQSQQTDPSAMPQLISSLRQRNCRVVATFIEDAAMLTQAINCGADFAMGYFIGEPIDNIGDASQVESFELT